MLANSTIKWKYSRYIHFSAQFLLWHENKNMWIYAIRVWSMEQKSKIANKNTTKYAPKFINRENLYPQKLTFLKYILIHCNLQFCTLLIIIFITGNSVYLVFIYKDVSLCSCYTHRLWFMINFFDGINIERKIYSYHNTAV